MLRLGVHLKSCLHCSQHPILYKKGTRILQHREVEQSSPRHYFCSDPQKGSYFTLNHANLYSSQDLFTTHFRKPVFNKCKLGVTSITKNSKLKSIPEE